MQSQTEFYLAPHTCVATQSAQSTERERETVATFCLCVNTLASIWIQYMSNLFSTKWLTTLIILRKTFLFASHPERTINGKKRMIYYNHHHIKSLEREKEKMVESLYCVNIEVPNNNNN